MSTDMPPSTDQPLPAGNVEPVAPPIPYIPPAPPPPPGYGQVAYAWHVPKSKNTAVLLAIFLGFQTWMYTYERDAWKFWTCFAFTGANILLSLITVGAWLFVAVPAGLGIWLWAIVDAGARPRQFYDLYPS